MQYLNPPQDKEIFVEVIQHLGIIVLNRPQQLNALSLSMLLSLDAQLKMWAKDKNVQAVIIVGHGERAFCAGGDIVSLYRHHEAGNPNGAHFFAVEYQLNQYIKDYPKPYIAFMHGITMGGGVGVSVHGSFRIGAENLSFAMPETGIGYFPDVGGTYFLSRCSGFIGTYLGLTGKRISYADAYYAKLIDSIIHYQDKDKFIRLLASQPDLSIETIEKCLQVFQYSANKSSLEIFRQDIDEIFSANTMEEILKRLTQKNNNWAAETLDTLKTKSPTSLKITLAALRKGACLSFADCMKMEYRLAEHFVNSHEVYEGIRAAVIDKDQQPKWRPATISEVDDRVIEAYFS